MLSSKGTAPVLQQWRYNIEMHVRINDFDILWQIPLQHRCRKSLKDERAKILKDFEKYV